MASEEFERMASLLGAVIEGQIRSANSLAAVARRYDEIQPMLDRIARNVAKMQEAQAISSGEIAGMKLALLALDHRIDGLDGKIDALDKSMQIRFEAVGHRFDEMESQLDRGFAMIKELQLEVVGQQNEILNAMQATLENRFRTNDLADRVERLERGFPPQ